MHSCIVVLMGEKIAERPFLLFNTADESAENKQLLINHWEKLQFSSEMTTDGSHLISKSALFLHTRLSFSCESTQGHGGFQVTGG